ncbi:MAG: protoheme IX farnesyltransferase [Anaerolineae bacterium]|nr:protoheme IX farnesyltransferase [Anaerolineae bacterium]
MVCKPASVALLVFVGLAAFVVGGRGAIMGWPLAVVLLAGTAGSAGANAVSCYLERDLDAAMVRTRRRPLPTGRISPPTRALWFGLALILVALVLSATLGPLTLGLMLLAQLDYLVIYILLTKRRSRWNVLWGSFSGGVPALFGWAAATGSLDLAPVLMAALVVLWIPAHIWTLAIFHTADYRRAGVPMLPAVVDLRKAARCLACTAVLAFLASLALYPAAGLGHLYLAVALVSGSVLAGGNVLLALRPSPRAAWLLFKLSSPYLLLVFGAMAVDALR